MDEWETYKFIDGRDYYFNSKENISTFIKPDKLETKKDNSLTNNWIKLKTKRGKPFYFNKKLKKCEWIIPENEMPNDTEDVDFPNTIAIGNNLVFSNVQNAHMEFNKLLEQKDVDHTYTWEQCVQDFMGNQIFRAIPSLSERKFLFDIFINKKVENYNLKKIKEQNVLKNNLLETVLKDDRITKETTFHDFNLIYRKFPDYFNIENKKRIFENIINEKRMEDISKTEVCKNKEIKEIENIFNSKLEINLGIKFSDIENDALLTDFEKEDILYCFEKRIMESEKKFYEDKKVESIKRRIDEHLNRKKFIDLLSTMYENQQIFYKMKFKQFFPIIKNNQVFKNLLGADGSTVKDLFFDFIDNLELKFKNFENLNYPQIINSSLNETDKKSLIKFLESKYEEKEEGEI